MINKIPPDLHTRLKKGQPGNYTETQEGVHVTQGGALGHIPGESSCLHAWMKARWAQPGSRDCSSGRCPSGLSERLPLPRVAPAPPPPQSASARPGPWRPGEHIEALPAYCRGCGAAAWMCVDWLMSRGHTL